MRTSAILKSIPVLLFFLIAFPYLSAQSVPRPSRIAPAANLDATLRLARHVPGWASSANRVGPVPDATPLRLTILLSRRPELQLAFQQLLEEQQSPSSPHYRQWLTPAAIGEQYGPTVDEIDTISRWVRSQGLQVTSVSPARTTIDITGPAATVASALKITLGTYQVGGQRRVAAATEPAIPLAFAPIISGIAGLTELTFQPAVATGPVLPLEAASGQSRTSQAHPLYTDSATGVHTITPGDFATIYDVARAKQAGLDGTGVRVAVLGQSNIVDTDITDLQSVTGLPQKRPNTVLVQGTTDPGFVPADQSQSTFEVGRVMTTAPGANVDLVIAGAAAGGIATALRYNIDMLLDPVMSISYSDCESAVSGVDVALYDGMFAQAAAEGISTFVTAGSSGAAGCAVSFQPPTGKEAKAMGNFLCASSYVTCVGATEFADAGTGTLYWSDTNNADLSSARGYIPEGAWNESILTATGGGATYQIAGTGSGPSAYILKPSWQTGTGVPSDKWRDTPDLAFSGSAHDGYFGCLAAVGADCSQRQRKTIAFFGGPAGPASMAGVAAILSQKLGRQLGSINPMLYLLASTTPTAFNDVTPVSSAADCTSITPNLCNNSTSGPSSPSGGVAGDTLQIGYDLLTGLGSLDVTTFVTAAALLPAPSQTTLTITASPTAVTAGQQVAFSATLIPSPQGTGTPTGSIYIYFNGQAVAVGTIQGDQVSGLSASFPTPGIYQAFAAYPGDLNFAGSISKPVQITVTAAPVAVSNFGVKATPPTISAGQSAVFTATVTGTPTPGGTVQFFSNGVSISSAVALTGGIASSPSVTFPTAGTYTITATYSGDSNYTSAMSQGFGFVVSAPTLVTVQNFAVTAAPTTIPAGQSAVFTATLTGSPVPSGNVQFFSNGVALGGTVALVNGVATTPSVSFPTAGTYPITATYSGDGTYASASSPALPFVVTSAVVTTPGLQLTASPNSISISRGATSGNSSTVTVHVVGGFSGAVAMSCSVSPMTGSPSSMPICNVTPVQLMLASGGSATAVVSFVTSLPQATGAAGQLAATPNGTATRVPRISLALLLVLLIPVSRRRAVRARMGRLSSLFLPLALLLGTAALSGCGGTVGSFLSTLGTTPGLYNVTVTATGDQVSSATVLSLTVK